MVWLISQRSENTAPDEVEHGFVGFMFGVIMRGPGAVRFEERNLKGFQFRP
jgi:hypothetical protein